MFKTDQQAIETLLTLAETYGGRWKNLTQQGGDRVTGVRKDDHVQNAEANLRVCMFKIYGHMENPANVSQRS